MVRHIAGEPAGGSRCVGAADRCGAHGKLAGADRRGQYGPLSEPGFSGKKPGRWKQLRDTVIGTTPQGYLGCAAAILNFDFVTQLPSLKLPVLMVCGEEDAGTPAAENRRLANLVPGARYEEIPSMRHFPNVEAPDAFNHIMLGWLDAHRRTR